MKITFKQGLFVSVLVIAAVAVGSWLGLGIYRETRDLREALASVRAEVQAAKQETLDEVRDIRREVKAIQAEARKRGDDRVRQVVSASDSDFLDELNAYSTRMVERVRAVE